MSDKSPEKIWVSAANNYYVDNQQDDNLGAYIHADKVDELLEQQRQMCADAIAEKVKPITLHPDVINACLNATRKSDEPFPPYIAVGNNELGETLGEKILCPHCDKTHDIQYGTDEAGNETRILSFYECDVTGKSYVAGIDGKRLK